VAKDAIKFIPGLGFAAYFHEFLFLKRDWKNDEPRIRKYLKEFVSSNLHHIWICIFPEGTFVDKGEKHVVLASQKFMAENVKDCKPFEYVLYPKSKGFDALMKQSEIQDILDLTLIYSFADGSHTALPLLETDSKRRVPDTLGLLSDPPKTIFIHVRHHKRTDSLDSKAWLTNCFQEKEKLLCTYNQTKGFSNLDSTVKDTSCPMNKMLIHLLFWIMLVGFIAFNLISKYFLFSICIFVMLILIGVRFQTS
jgi:hypothetical protein